MTPTAPSDVPAILQRHDDLIEPTKPYKSVGQGVDVIAHQTNSIHRRFVLGIDGLLYSPLKKAICLPPWNSSHENAWNIHKIALFEAGLTPAIRLKMLKEDTSRTYTKS